MPRGRPRLTLEETAPSKSPTMLDIAWAAGIYEGEGCVGSYGAFINIQIIQKDKWILDKMQSLFGGKIYKNGEKYHTLRLTHERAFGFLLTVFTFLSPRRRNDIRTVLKLIEFYDGTTKHKSD